MTTFAEARRIVAAEVGPRYRIAAHGWEDATHFLIVAEWRGPEIMCGAPATLVDKRTGKLLSLPVVGNFDRLDAMTAVGVRGATRERASGA